jgi:hypothetical protein
MNRDVINLKELFVTRGFSQAIMVGGTHKTQYMGGPK